MGITFTSFIILAPRLRRFYFDCSRWLDGSTDLLTAFCDGRIGMEGFGGNLQLGSPCGRGGSLTDGKLDSSFRGGLQLLIGANAGVSYFLDPTRGDSPKLVKKYKYFDFEFHKQKVLSPSSSLTLSFVPLVVLNDFLSIFLQGFSFFQYNLLIFSHFNPKQAIFQFQDLFYFLNLFLNFCNFQELIIQLHSLPLEEYFSVLLDLSDCIQQFQAKDQNYHFLILQAKFLPCSICQPMDQKAINQHLAFSLDLISKENQQPHANHQSKHKESFRKHQHKPFYITLKGHEQQKEVLEQPFHKEHILKTTYRSQLRKADPSIPQDLHNKVYPFECMHNLFQVLQTHQDRLV